MIPTNITYRTFHIKYNGKTGSCFAFDYNSKQYFLTAKHIVGNIENTANIEFYFNDKWNLQPITIVGHCENSDISVMMVENVQTNAESVLADSDNIYYSQQIFYLGFPYGINTMLPNPENKAPMPFVKTGILSNILINKPDKILYLDGINNPGFSGGPVVYIDKTNTIKLCGIISGFRFERQFATIKDKETEVEIKMNTGIIYANGIEPAIEIIEQNPIGRDIK